jgi:hypothetical protein
MTGTDGVIVVFAQQIREMLAQELGTDMAPYKKVIKVCMMVFKFDFFKHGTSILTRNHAHAARMTCMYIVQEMVQLHSCGRGQPGSCLSSAWLYWGQAGGWAGVCVGGVGRAWGSTSRTAQTDTITTATQSNLVCCCPSHRPQEAIDTWLVAAAEADDESQQGAAAPQAVGRKRGAPSGGAGGERAAKVARSSADGGPPGGVQLDTQVRVCLCVLNM